MYALFVIGTRIGITILFVIALVVLVIINIFRIVAIWFFVAFAPLLILLQFADKEKSYQTGLLTKFSISNIVKAIFAPVIAVGLMSIGLIVVVVMQ
jgi:1,4-dihydroxy-2-naphthoate octaprenyltransferase